MCVFVMNKKITEAVGYRQQENEARPKINKEKAKVSPCIPQIRRELGQQTCLNPIALLGFLERAPEVGLRYAARDWVLAVTGIRKDAIRHE
jgi:hypothetical protein